MQKFIPENIFRNDVDALTPYKPVAPFDVLAKELGIPAEKIVKLDANENPYGASPRAKAVLAQFPFPHIYPDPAARHLRDALSAYLSVPAEHIIIGSGGDEVIDMLLRLVINPGDAIINTPPTFGMYPINARLNRAEVIDVPRRADFSLDVPAIEQAVVDNPRAKVLFLTSPNNPDGGITPMETLERLLRLPILIMWDEAYAEFCRQNTAPLVLKHPNLIVLRTFSKWAGLAGLRLGYGIFPTPIAEMMWRVKSPYNANALAQAAALASLQDLDYLMDTVQKIIAARDQFLQDVTTINWLHPYPSHSNFVLMRVGGGRTAEGVQAALKGQGILVRNYTPSGLHGHLRIGVGKPEDMQQLLHTLAKM